MKKIHSSDKPKPSVKPPSLAMSLLSQGNNGSFNKPFARKYGLYAAILLSELVYLQDLFIHKQGRGMAVEDDNGFLIIGFFRTYEDLNTSTSIPLGTLRRQEKVGNPINILRNLGIITTTTTTVGETFRKVIVYSVIANAVQDHITLATAEFYEHLNNKRLGVNEVDQPKMEVLKQKRGPISDEKPIEQYPLCTKDTTVESKGLQSEIVQDGAKYRLVNEEGEKDQTAQKTRPIMHKRHPSNNNTNSSSTHNSTLKTDDNTPTNYKTNPSGTNQKQVTSGTNLEKVKIEKRVSPDSNRYTQELVDTLYSNEKGLYAPTVQEYLIDFFLGDKTILEVYENLLEICKLPTTFRASNKDVKILEQLRDMDNSLAYTEAFSEKIIRNAVLIACKKRKRAFGQLFVGINMKTY